MVTITVLVALLVCLIPDHHRRAAVGHRYRGHGSHGARQRHRDFRPRRGSRGRRRRAAARQDRHDHARRSQCHGVSYRARPSRRATSPTPRSSPRSADETPEGRSIVVLAKQQFQLRGRDLAGTTHTFHKFSAQTRMSGVDLEGRKLRKGAADAIRKFVEQEGGLWPGPVERARRHRCASRRDAAGGRRRAPRARRRRAARHRQGRHSRALRGAAANGHQDRHGHRRQPSDRGGHCGRSGRR